MAAVLLCALLAAAPETARAQVLPIVITELRFLDFGWCENIGNTTYSVDAAETPGVTGCTASASAKFLVTGDAGAKVTIALPNRVDATNGPETLRVTLSQTPSGGNIRFDASGNLTVYVGGNFRVPAAGLTTSGLFFPAVATTLTVLYK